jgi:uncharacterized RDD family membrane protein YckC
MPRDFRQIDARVDIVTPENIKFDYQLAGPWQRLPAYGADLVVRAIFLLLIFFAIQVTFGAVGLDTLGIGLMLVIWFVTSWFYGGLFETYWDGQTPGKRLFHLRVVTVEGRPLTALQAVMRNILREADLLPLVPIPGLEVATAILPLGQVGLLTPAFNQHYQRLGDLACGTMVIHERRQWVVSVARIEEPAALALVALFPPKLVASRSLSRTVSRYVDRRRWLGSKRRVEIAQLLAGPLVEQYGLPRDSDPDLVLCAFYQRLFFAEESLGLSTPPPGSFQVELVPEVVADVPNIALGSSQ